MRDRTSITSITQNKINKKSSKSKIKKLKSLSNNLSHSGGGGGDADRIPRQNQYLNNEKIQKSISVLAKVLAKGFFAEVNCKILTDNLLGQLASHVQHFILKEVPSDINRSLVVNSFSTNPFLNEYARKLYLGDFDDENVLYNRREIDSVNIILYKTKDDQPFTHEITNEGEKFKLGTRWSLPHIQFESLWETLEFDLPLKTQLMQYVFTVIRFDKANIDRTIIHCNQTVLLYGPPGCGKTTICKGLAQKVAIRMKELFSRFYFYELNAGSLFSKWFSESSHNLSKFFEDVREICSDPLTFVIILIDEVESLSMSRTSSLSSNEPSDMLRVVNTLLTQIDRLKSYSNILILTTSNLIEIIDEALIDRSDLVLFIGPPSIKSIFHIYRDCVKELFLKQLVYAQIDSDYVQENLSCLARSSEGLSGRTLRKLPMMAFSHIQQSEHFILPEQLFQAMYQQIQQQKNTKNHLQQANR